MTSQECACRDKRTIDSIRSVLGVHDQLRQYAAALQVTIDNATIVLQGRLPNDQLKAALEPAVRRAGVLSKISNQVQVG